MSQPAPFGEWLAARITEAGYRSPSAFAKAADLQPSMVLRWIGEKVQPTPDGLLKAAGPLGVTPGEMLARGLDVPELSTVAAMHPLAVRVQRILEDASPVPDAEKQLLATVLDRLMDPVERKWFRIVSVSWDPDPVRGREKIANSTVYSARQKKALLEEHDRLNPPDA